MEADVVTNIAALAREGDTPHTVEIGGTTYVLKPAECQLVDPRSADPECRSFTVHTLTGLIDFLQVLLAEQVEPAPVRAKDVILHVAGPNEVFLESAALRGRFRQREQFACAAFKQVLGESFRFGTFYPAEWFNIALQSLFEQTDDLGSVLALVGNLKEGAEKTAADNGITQTVTSRAGVVTVAEVEVPNPVTLAPYRTFLEVEQPASPFVLRLKGGAEDKIPTAALFEADGGAWRLEAIKNVAEFLRDHDELPEGVRIIA